MKVKNKILTAMVFGTILSGLIIPNKANAALQSNGGTPEIKSSKDWMIQIRQMQELGGTLGRTDSINTTNLMGNSTDLDIHMEKNTEYGAMAILSASAYGNPNKIENGGTTTGNSTGIVINTSNYEKVSAVTNDTSFMYSRDVANRYKNEYAYMNDERKPGDATIETSAWHGTGGIGQYFNHSITVLCRAYKSIFAYYGNGASSAVPREDSKLPTRAVIVVGTGL